MAKELRLRQLRYFVTAVDKGSISAAANALLISQPSLSQQISDLERTVGVPLLERRPRGIVLTSAGRVFHAEAAVAVRAADRALRLARHVDHVDSGELEISTVSSLAAGLLPPVLREFRRRHPGVTLRLHEFQHADSLERSFFEGVGDLAVGPRPQAPTEDLVSIGYEEFMVVLQRDDPAARGDFVDLHDLSNRSWVLFTAEHGLSKFVDMVCADFGFTPKGGVRTAQVDAAARLAAAGLGPALLPANALPPGLDAAVRRLAQPVLRELTVYSRSPFSRPISEFVDVLRLTVDVHT